MPLDTKHLALHLGRGVVVFGAALFGTWLALPSPIGSLPWIPSPAPALDGPYWANEALTQAQVRFPELKGAEDIAFDADGRVYTGLEDGRIVRIDGDVVVDVVNTGGRPLGMEFSPHDGLLYVCDGKRGLLVVDVSRKSVGLVVDTVENDPFKYTNDVEIDHDGVVYFTDGSAVWGYGQDLEDILDQRPTGRVLRYDPSTGVTTVLARELAFANGLALAPDERSLIVAETGRYRLWRLWLDGDQKNLKEVITENLPGSPAHLSVSPRGTIWVALSSTRRRLFDAIQPYPLLKDATASLPSWLRPQPVKWGFVVEVGFDGKPLRSLQDVNAVVVPNLSVAEERADGSLWMGRRDGHGITILRSIPDAPNDGPAAIRQR